MRLNCLGNSDTGTPFYLRSQKETDPDYPNPPPEKGALAIPPDIIKKGLQSLENPMLRGSYNLVLSNNQMDSLDCIAHNAFIEITSHALFTPEASDPSLGTAFLQTDTAKTLKGRPGVYVIKNVENGMCIVGQTIHLRARLNQYSIRGVQISPKRDRINKNFYNAVQLAIQNGLKYNQIFQPYAVYSWVDSKKKALDVSNSLSLRNEMNYLEHRLILAFFECKLCYNLEDVFPELNTVDSLPSPPAPVENTNASQGLQSSLPITKSAHKPKPFKVGSNYFRSKPHYSKYRALLSEAERKKFKAVPALRAELEKNASKLKSNPNLNVETRYLTEQEVKEAEAKSLFMVLPGQQA